MIIIHGGQTGVDRGAHYGALAGAHEIQGYAPLHRRDEDGPIPRDVMRYLDTVGESKWLSQAAQYADRTERNVRRSTHVLVIVDDRVRTSGTRLTLAIAERVGRPTHVIYAREDLDAYGTPKIDIDIAIKEWLSRGPSRPIGLMIAGPRASQWPAAFEVTFGIVRGF